MQKKHNLTQLQLAEKLGITDRAVSKWENGKLVLLNPSEIRNVRAQT